MAKASGGTRKSDGGLKAGDADYKGTIGRVETLKAIENKEVYKAAKEAISRFHAILGVRQKKVKLADLEDGVGGVHVTRGGESEGVYLSKSIFKPASATTQSVADWARRGYESGHITKTNKPVAHIITHELAHATWNEHMTSPRAVTAGKDIKQLYKRWVGDKKKKGYGRYAATNVSEFFAETAAKAVHGNSDRYTIALQDIIKRHRL